MIKKWLMINVVASLVVLGLWSPGMAKKVTQEEALNVAKNWITLVLHTQKKWGQSKTAEVEDIQEIERNGKVLGYFCKVRPRGFIVISSHRRLPAVKAYSETSDLDPASEKELADLLKMKMERHLAAMEAKAGRLEAARDEDLEGIFEFDHRATWRDLERSPSVFENLIGLQEITIVSSPILLSTNWNQIPPYNDDCPDTGCNWGFHNTNAYAGCVAIAGAQVMRYWAWPPWSEFRWRDMLDEYIWNSASQWFDDPNGNPVTDAQRAAVAHLVSRVGALVSTEYDCDGSSARLSSCPGCTDLLDALEDHLRYHTAAEDRSRDDYSALDWFRIIKSQIHFNTPMPYHIEGHTFVCDGWQEKRSDGVVTARLYHMNWGHGSDSGKTMWYALGGLPKDESKEKLIQNAVPDCSMPSSLANTIYLKKDDPWRYFNQNTNAENVVFEAGQMLQFHHNIKVQGNVDFNGAPSPDQTWMFSGGVDYSAGNKLTGIAIMGGKIWLRNGGAIRLPRSW